MSRSHRTKADGGRLSEARGPVRLDGWAALVFVGVRDMLTGELATEVIAGNGR